MLTILMEKYRKNLKSTILCACKYSYVPMSYRQNKTKILYAHDILNNRS